MNLTTAVGLSSFGPRVRDIHNSCATAFGRTPGSGMPHGGGANCQCSLFRLHGLLMMGTWPPVVSVLVSPLAAPQQQGDTVET